MMGKAVSVYYFRTYDITVGEYVQSERPATLHAIRRSRGEPIRETAVQIDESELDDEGFRKRELS
jgi:hypothetical protein